MLMLMSDAMDVKDQYKGDASKKGEAEGKAAADAKAAAESYMARLALVPQTAIHDMAVLRGNADTDLYVIKNLAGFETNVLVVPKRVSNSIKETLEAK